jgi:hypothetical protein
VSPAQSEREVSAAWWKRALTVLGWTCFGFGLLVPFVTWVVSDLQTAANVAQLVSVPLTAAGLLGISVPPRAHDASSARADNPNGTPVRSVRPTQAAPPSRWHRGLRSKWTPIFRIAGIAGGVILAVLSVAMWMNPSLGPPSSTPPSGVPQPDYMGYFSQEVTVIDGLLPVPFSGGTTWKWLDLKPGTTVVTLSPGGGKRNDGLRMIGGEMMQTGTCSYDSRENYVEWTFKADGHSLGGTAYSGSSLLPNLPDHVDKLTLEMRAVVHEGCAAGLSWKYPSVLRSDPVPR